MLESQESSLRKKRVGGKRIKGWLAGDTRVQSEREGSWEEDGKRLGCRVTTHKGPV